MTKKSKFILRFVSVFVFAAILATVAVIGIARREEQTVPALSQYGSRGEEVKNIQRKLKNKGYYTGEIDGIYGSKTTAAVKRFQSDSGLTVDGIAGPKTLKALGISSSSSQSSNDDNDLYLLARIISAEARGEPYTGQVAVGAVVLNRVKHPSFPNSIAGVIYQSSAFTAVVDGQFDQPIADSAWNAARDALGGWDPTGGCIYYYNPKTATNKWIRQLPIDLTIGNHVFSHGINGQ